MYPLKHSLGTALSPSICSVYSYFTYMIGLTKRSHVAPKMQHVIFCDSIVRFDWCRTKRIDSLSGKTWIPLCARDGSVITWGRGEGETLSHHVMSTQCAEGLNKTLEGASTMHSSIGSNSTKSAVKISGTPLMSTAFGKSPLEFVITVGSQFSLMTSNDR